MTTPYTPRTKAESFAHLTAQGMAPDTAFIVATIAAASPAPSDLDTQYMAEIRELVVEYAKYTGQESLLWAMG